MPGRATGRKRFFLVQADSNCKQHDDTRVLNDFQLTGGCFFLGMAKPRAGVSPPDDAKLVLLLGNLWLHLP